MSFKQKKISTYVNKYYKKRRIIWKKFGKILNGYEGLYQISNLGNVKVYNRNIFNSKCMCLRKSRILKNNKNGRGYINVCLTKDGKSKNYLVHRLVAKAFIPNPNNYEQVNHIDENKINNRVDNLEWCTQKYNQQYSKHKRSNKIIQLDINNNILNIYPSSFEASNFTNIDRTSIIKCCNNKRKSAGGYKWQYIKKFKKVF